MASNNDDDDDKKRERTVVTYELGPKTLGKLNEIVHDMPVADTYNDCDLLRLEKMHHERVERTLEGIHVVLNDQKNALEEIAGYLETVAEHFSSTKRHKK